MKIGIYFGRQLQEKKLHDLNEKKTDMNLYPIFNSDLGEIQTPNLLSRNQVHYSVMLRGLNAVNQ